jgi:hypothetical protein
VTLPRYAAPVALLFAALALVGAFTLTPLGDAVQRALDPSVVAAPAAVAAQREAAERAVARGHAKAADQLRRTRELRLPIPDAEAARIAAAGEDALALIRREAFVALAGALGLRGEDFSAYVLDAEARTEGRDFAADQGVLLAPSLHAIVARANERFAQAADTTTRELTRPRSPSPSPSPVRGSPTPSPTGR